MQLEKLVSVLLFCYDGKTGRKGGDTQMKETILVVDDEKEIADLLELYLQNEAFSVVKCRTAREALQHIETDCIDLAILDVMLPDTDGFSLCRKLRESHTYPVIMLTAKVSSGDKLNGLALGADDYVTKPFDPVELVARVKAQLRRRKKYDSLGGGAEDSIVLPGLMLELRTRKCYLEDRTVDLTPTEFSILWVLCRNRGKTVSSEELFHALWGDAYFNKSTNPIPVHIRHLREKLNDRVEKPAFIKTVWGVGYQIEN